MSSVVASSSLRMLGNATSSASIVSRSPSPDFVRRSTFGVFGWVVLSTVGIIPSILYYVITVVTITIPTWIYRVLSISLTVTVNFSTLAFLVVAIVSSISYFLRYRFHTYARLPAETPRREAEVDVFPDQEGGNSKPGLSTYLDEFLSAIKVFGYLEK